MMVARMGGSMGERARLATTVAGGVVVGGLALLGLLAVTGVVHLHESAVGQTTPSPSPIAAPSPTTGVYVPGAGYSTPLAVDPTEPGGPLALPTISSDRPLACHVIIGESGEDPWSPPPEPLTIHGGFRADPVVYTKPGAAATITTHLSNGDAVGHFVADARGVVDGDFRIDQYEPNILPTYLIVVDVTVSLGSETASCADSYRIDVNA